MEAYDLAEAAERSGVDTAELSRLVELGIVRHAASGTFTPGDVRRIGLVHGLLKAGISLEGLGEAVRSGRISLDFLDAPAFERFSTLGGESFAEVAHRMEIPVDLLLFVREVTGSVAPLATDRVRTEELPFAALIEIAFKAGYRPAAIEQLIRAQGDGMRRMAETESAIWQSEVIAPATAAGKRPDEVLGGDFGDRLSLVTERAVVAMYHLQQARAWTADLIEELELALARAGLHSRIDHPPAMCFVDISGYTRHTQEHGDAAAAKLAEQLGRLVQRTSTQHGGRPVKWLGDGVMIHFPDPGRGVEAALDMVDGVVEAGLPPAHVGLHAGPVIFQEGDYYGQTVNVAARIAASAAAGEVIVSRAVVDASGEARVVFREVGPVELKGVAGAMRLYAAYRRG